MGPRQRIVLAGAVLLVALAAAATASPRAHVALRYVALGDSFSSGEGVPPFRPGTDQYLPVRDTCHRSFRGYPALIAGRRSSPGTWGFWACSGALTSDMTGTNHEDPNEIAQLDRISRPGTSDPRVDLITVTIGGNDAQFGVVTMACFFARIVPGLEDCQADWRAKVKNAIARLRGTLPRLYRTMHQRAPNARILVLGYPNPFPASAPPLSKCRLWLEPADIRFFHDEVEALNASVRYAASKTTGAQVRYLAPTGFAGHDACSDTSWFNGLNFVPTEFRYSFHPNLLGQRRLARIALAAI